MMTDDWDLEEVAADEAAADEAAADEAAADEAAAEEVAADGDSEAFEDGRKGADLKDAKRRFRVVFALCTLGLMITGPVLNYYYQGACTSSRGGGVQ